MKVLVVGAGAAGLFAAYSAATHTEAKVTVAEKNEKSGKKIYITGKGRCNLTNLCTPREFLDNVVRNPKFLYSAIYGFTPEDTVDFFEKNGLKLKTERGNRVFPVSDKASDVTKTLRAAAEKAGAEFRFNMSVEKLTQKTENLRSDVKRKRGKFRLRDTCLRRNELSVNGQRRKRLPSRRVCRT